MRPFLTPSEKRIGNRVSTPGMPFGTQRKLVRPFGASLPCVSYRNGQWSEENSEKTCCCRPAQHSCWLFSSRGGGEQTYLAPSMLRPSMSLAVSTRYCGQVSP